MSSVVPEKGTMPSGYTATSDSKCEVDSVVADKAKVTNRALKKLSKQNVVEEPYDNGYLPVRNNEKDVTTCEGLLSECFEKTEAPVTNISRGAPRSINSRPKFLVRSQALCGEDDFQNTTRFGGLPLGSTTRSSASSLSIESSQDFYTDSTGIDLQSFIVNTLHKNMKDRQMLLQLEQQMTGLINDSSRNSQKFPVMSSYNRMLVHRVAAFFGLDHNVDQSGTAVVVNKNSQTRIPNTSFSSLIRSDTFTDEPRKYLKRSVQSYEEGRRCLGNDLLSCRKAHSFDGDYAAGKAVSTACQFSVNPVQMNVFSVTSSNSSSDLVGPQLMESSGNCYSFGELQTIGVRTSLENNGIYGGFAIPPLYQWSTSKNYTSFAPGAEMAPNIITSSVPSSSAAPVIGSARNIKKAASFDTERSLRNNSGSQLAGERRIAPLRRSMTDRHRPDLLVVREPSIPEHGTVLSTGSESIAIPSWQSAVFDAPRVEASSSNQFFLGPQCITAQPYVQFVQSNITNPRPDIQCVAQQIDELCVSDQADLAAPQVYTYQLPPLCPNPSLSHQVPLPGSLCQTQPYILSVLPQGYVVASTQQPSVCRFGNISVPYQNGEYSPASLINCSEFRSVDSRNTGTVSTGAVEQI